MSHNIKKRPLCVDLDGTLCKTDLLLECILLLLKNNPFFIFLFPFWLVKGKAFFKEQITNRVDLNVETLPFNKPFLDFLKSQHEEGRTLFLATASNEKTAGKVACHLGIFKEVLASTERLNLSGLKKLKAMEDKFGKRGFDYAGNSKDDLVIWRHCNEAILVNASPLVLRKAKNLSNVQRVFGKVDLKGKFFTLLKAIRVFQWIKNILIFLPLFTSHRIFNIDLFVKASMAFLTFSFCAASVYLYNDLLDLEADRRHWKKKERPFAAGKLSLHIGFILTPVFIIISLALAWFLFYNLIPILLIYYFITLYYSHYVKKVIILDVIFLSSFYCIRIIAGYAVTGVAFSAWLISFSMFLFLSLALIKRYSELMLLKPNSALKGRGYISNDLDLLSNMGISSGFISNLVLALYINSQNVIQLYTSPILLWFLCPLVLYWISRMWMKAHRGEISEDPLVFAMKDKVSHLIVLVMIMIVLWAKRGWMDLF